jgi:hypothetical protein
MRSKIFFFIKVDEDLGLIEVVVDFLWSTEAISDALLVGAWERALESMETLSSPARREEIDWWSVTFKLLISRLKPLAVGAGYSNFSLKRSLKGICGFLG